jgi:hypothetical protein
MGPSYRTTRAALAAAIPILIYFVLEKWVGLDLPSEVEGAIGTIVGVAILALGSYARDNRVSTEEARGAPALPSAASTPEPPS